MNDEQFILLATKYLSKEASLEEIELFNSMRKDRKYSALFTRIAEQWNKMEDTESVYGYDVEKGLKRLAAKIRNYNPAFQWEQKAKQQHYYFHQPLFFRIAAACAVLILFIAGAFFISHVLNRRPDEIIWNEKKTVMGEKVILTLLDGTKITLNADSKLRYPVCFGEESREVSLQGEAYFEVTHNADKPFIVHTGNISTTDLGTKFDVKAFPNDTNITISLDDGKVKVSTDGLNTKGKEIILAPTQQLVYNKADEKSSINPFDIQETIGWKDNILVFDNVSLSNMLVPLERYFGVKFEIADPSLADRPIKANFRNESFWTVVKVIEKATGLAYKTSIEKNELKKIIFYGK